MNNDINCLKERPAARLRVVFLCSAIYAVSVNDVIPVNNTQHADDRNLDGVHTVLHATQLNDRLLIFRRLHSAEFSMHSDGNACMKMLEKLFRGYVYAHARTHTM